VLLDFQKLQALFPQARGFTYPDWDGLWLLLSQRFTGDETFACLDEMLCHWARRLKADLGGSFHITANDDILLVSPLPAPLDRWLATEGAATKLDLRDTLGRAAWQGWRTRDLVLVFQDDDDYDSYALRFHPPDYEQVPGVGVQLDGGWPHLAMLWTGPYEAGPTLRHELVHTALAYLRPPLWLNEGLAAILENKAHHHNPPPAGAEPTTAPACGTETQTIGARWRELEPRHRAFWNAETIQRFWAGLAFGDRWETVELSYSLAATLVNSLANDPSDLGPFIAAADYDDAGQGAAMDVLGLELGAAVARLLGPGDWHPVRKAMAELWKTAQRAAKPT
jgi:hypothetical protein